MYIQTQIQVQDKKQHQGQNVALIIGYFGVWTASLLFLKNNARDIFLSEQNARQNSKGCWIHCYHLINISAVKYSLPFCALSIIMSLCQNFQELWKKTNQSQNAAKQNVFRLLKENFTQSLFTEAGADLPHTMYLHVNPFVNQERAARDLINCFRWQQVWKWKGQELWSSDFTRPRMPTPQIPLRLVSWSHVRIGFVAKVTQVKLCWVKDNGLGSKRIPP